VNAPSPRAGAAPRAKPRVGRRGISSRPRRDRADEVRPGDEADRQRRRGQDHDRRDADQQRAARRDVPPREHDGRRDQRQDEQAVGVADQVGEPEDEPAEQPAPERAGLHPAVGEAKLPASWRANRNVPSRASVEASGATR